MRMTVLEAQAVCRRRLLSLRGMYRFLESPRFEEALKQATDDQLKRLDLILKSDSSKDLRNWARDVLSKSIYDQTIRELMAVARDMMIPKWSRMSREQLIRAIEKKKQG